MLGSSVNMSIESACRTAYLAIVIFSLFDGSLLSVPIYNRFSHRMTELKVPLPILSQIVDVFDLHFPDRYFVVLAITS